MGNIASNTVNQMAFCPPPPTYRKKDVNMWLETDRGSRIPAFHIRQGNPLTVLVSHANAEDLGIVLAFWSWISEALGVDVLAYEYSGYGHSTGTPSEENMYSDAKAALALLVDGFKLRPERDIVLYGKSLGSCPTCYLASKTRVRGVVIVSGLASGARVLFPTTKVRHCPASACCIHGGSDRIPAAATPPAPPSSPCIPQRRSRSWTCYNSTMSAGLGVRSHRHKSSTARMMR